MLQAEAFPTVYVSGDNASMVPAAQIAQRFPAIDVAVLFAGASRLTTKNQGRPLTLTGQRAADVTAVLAVPQVVVAHIEGWSIYSENIADVRTAFDEAGIADRLVANDAGFWAPLADAVASPTAGPRPHSDPARPGAGQMMGEEHRAPARGHRMTETTPAQIVLTRRSAAYWRVTFNHPPLNIFGPESIPELEAVITALETDDDVKVVVFDSAVDGFFLTHYDFVAKLEDSAGFPRARRVCRRCLICWSG